MKILIRNLPARTERKELRRLVYQSCAPSILERLLGRANPEILSCERFRAIDPRDGATEYWCILVVRPEAAAERAIKGLHGQAVAGRRVVVKQFIDRCPPDSAAALGPPGGVERRRPLIIERVEDITSDAYQDVTRPDR